MGNRVFSMKPIAAAKLMRSWGWVDEGPVRAHGTTRRWRWPPTNEAVSLHTVGVKRYEHGQMQALNQAAQIQGLPLQRFLDGPPKKTAQATVQVDLGEIDRRLQAEAVATTKEQEMTREAGSRWPENKGITDAIVGYMRTTGGRAIKGRDVHSMVEAKLGIAVDRYSVMGILSQKAGISEVAAKRNGIYIENVGRGVYRWNPNKYAATVSLPSTPVSSQDETPVKSPAPEAQAATVDTHVPAAAAVSNGSGPELLSKVSALDGGRYLMQGDDAALYVVRMVRLDVTGV